MKLVNVATASLNQTPLDWENNKSNIIQAISKAKAKNVSILCLPELCICGYGSEDTFFSSDMPETSLEVLNEILPETEDIIVNLGLPIKFQDRLYDTSCVVANKKICGFIAKKSLALDGIHYEPRWFKAWEKGRRTSIKLGEIEYPFGDFYFNFNGVSVGFEICEEAWVAERISNNFQGLNVDIVLNPSASHFAFGKFEERKKLANSASRKLNNCYLYSNLVGNEAGRIVYDGGCLISVAGGICNQEKRFSFLDNTTIVSSVELDYLRKNRVQDSTKSFVKLEGLDVDFSFKEVSTKEKSLKVESWEKGSYVKEEEFSRAIALGLFDYLRKSRSKGFVISLSGGVDSCATACLVYLMIRFAEKEIGLSGIKNKLSYISELSDLKTSEEVVKVILTCVYQRTENNSKETELSASKCAKAIHADYISIEIDSLVNQYIEIISGSLNQDLSWDKHDLALQNIQARVRAPGVWLIANLRNQILLATSNRSEAAVGYTTMDGDTCGGLSPIAGIDKAFLIHWLEWLEKVAPEDVHPIAALENVNSLSPTAELRPKNSKQTDEDDLMPYVVLDLIERYAIRDKKSPLQVFRLVVKEASDYTEKQVFDWVNKFFILWSRNQWKRERYAPSFHLDDENLDPKTWCRFPILSGSFKRELNELKQYFIRDSK